MDYRLKINLRQIPGNVLDKLTVIENFEKPVNRLQRVRQNAV